MTHKSFTVFTPQTTQLNGKVGLGTWNWLANYAAFTLLAPPKTTTLPEKSMGINCSSSDAPW